MDAGLIHSLTRSNVLTITETATNTIQCVCVITETTNVCHAMIQPLCWLSQSSAEQHASLHTLINNAGRAGMNDSA